MLRRHSLFSCFLLPHLALLLALAPCHRLQLCSPSITWPVFGLHPETAHCYFCPPIPPGKMVVSKNCESRHSHCFVSNDERGTNNCGSHDCFKQAWAGTPCRELVSQHYLGNSRSELHFDWKDLQVSDLLNNSLVPFSLEARHH